MVLFGVRAALVLVTPERFSYTKRSCRFPCNSFCDRSTVIVSSILPVKGSVSRRGAADKMVTTQATYASKSRTSYQAYTPLLV